MLAGNRHRPLEHVRHLGIGGCRFGHVSLLLKFGRSGTGAASPAGPRRTGAGGGRRVLGLGCLFGHPCLGLGLLNRLTGGATRLRDLAGDARGESSADTCFVSTGLATSDEKFSPDNAVPIVFLDPLRSRPGLRARFHH